VRREYPSRYPSHTVIHGIREGFMSGKPCQNRRCLFQLLQERSTFGLTTLTFSRISLLSAGPGCMLGFRRHIKNICLTSASFVHQLSLHKLYFFFYPCPSALIRETPLDHGVIRDQNESYLEPRVIHVDIYITVQWPLLFPNQPT
jgi:hypothetical protein